LSNELAKPANKGKSPKEVFDTYCKSLDEKAYEKIFSERMEDLVIKLALIYRDGKKNGQLDFTDSTEIWETLMKTEKTIQRTLAIANGFNRRMGAEEFFYAFNRVTPYSLTHATRVRTAAENQYTAWKDYRPSLAEKTNDQVLEEIQKFGISTETLNLVTEAMT